MSEYSEDQNNSFLTSRLQTFSETVSLVVVSVGWLVILGWVFDITVLKRILPNLPTMKVNAALCFILGGASLRLWHWKGQRKREIQVLIFSFAFLIITIALLTLIQYGFHLNLGIDQLIMQQPEPTGSQAAPGRMPPNTVLAFVLEGSALLLLNTNRPNYLAIQAMAVGAGLIGYLGVLGYVQGSPYFYTAGSFTGIAVHTASSFLLLSSGILCARPDRGLMRLICSDGAGGLMARRLLPLAIALPPLVSGLCEMGYRWHLYSQEVQVTLSSASDIVLFSVLIGWSADSLNRFDSRRRRAELELQVSQARFSGILKNANDAIISVDANQRITLFNQVAEKIFGYGASEVLGQPLDLLLPKRSVSAHRQYISNLGKSDGTARRMGECQEIFGRCKDGTEFPAEASISKLDMGDEQVFTAFVRDITERKQAETALRESEARFHAFMNHNPAAAWITDADGRMLYVSQTYLRTFQLPTDHIVGQLIGDLYSPEIAQQFLDNIQTVARTRQVMQTIEMAPCLDGSVSEFLVYKFPISEASGQVVVGGVAIEISDHLRAEEMRSQLAAIVKSSDDAIISQSLDGIILSWNPGAQRLYGYDASEVIGQPISILIPPNHLDEMLQILRKVKQGEHVEHYETVRVCKDGQLLDVSITISPIKDAAGKIVGASAIKRNITEQKQAQKALRLSEERLQLALEASNDGLWDWNIEAGEIYLSPRWIEMLGYEWDELPQEMSTWERLIHPDDQPWVLDRLNAHLQDSSVSYAFDYRLRTKSGEWKWLADYGKVVVRDQNGSPLRMIGTHKDISARKRAEAALKESEERWQLAVRGTNDGIWDWNVKTNEVFFSTRWKEMLGYEEQEIGNHVDEWTKRVHPDDLDWVLQVVQEHFAKKTPFYMSEHRVLCKDGTYKWILDRGQALWDEDGTVVRMAGSHTDISNRKTSEQALRESEARFQAFMNHSPLLAWITDGEGKMLYCNHSFENWIKRSASELVGKTIFELHPPEIAQEHFENIRHVINTRQVLETNESALYSDGTRHEFLTYKFPLNDVNGQCLVGGMAANITERRQAEKALQESEEKLRHQEAQLNTIVTTTSDGIMVLDRQGWVRFANPAAAQLFDIPLAELCNSQWGIPLTDTLEVELVRHNGEIRTAEMKATQTQWLSEAAYVVALRDISFRKQAEVELQKAKEAAEVASQAKSIFLANMSHELRTPLNVILGFTQLMIRDSLIFPEQRENLQIVSKSGNHLLTLINDVLDLSKIEAGRITLDESSFDLIGLVRSLQEMLHQKATKKGLQLNLEIAPDIPQYVTADSNKLHQILLNLLSNAIKFTPAGSVTLQVVHRSWFMVHGKEESAINHEQSRDELSTMNHQPSTMNLLFEVSDTGVGIAPTELDTIFDAFVQTQSGKGSNEGTGLGLTISRKFVQLMGGDLTVKSPPAQGSTFSFEIPVRLANASEVQLPQTHRQVIGLAGGQPPYRILIVDDQPENRQLLVKLLTQLGLEVREAANGQEAITLWQEWQPHLILMDIRMPVMDGYEAAQQIRSSEQGQSTVIIALTAQASNSDRTFALKAGCNDYISKPFQQEELFAKMGEHLGVRYLYAECDPQEAAITQDAGQLDSFELTPESLSMMPSEWINNLHEAAQLCDDEEILHLIEQIPSEQASLIANLTHLARDFQFGSIVELTQPMSHEP